MDQERFDQKFPQTQEEAKAVFPISLEVGVADVQSPDDDDDEEEVKVPVVSWEDILMD